MSTVVLMRRHGPSCPASHPQQSSTTEPEERRKNSKKCSCRIYASGTLNGVFRKLATKQRDWERAREVLAPYLKAGRWDLEAPPPPSPGLAGEGGSGGPTSAAVPLGSDAGGGDQNKKLTPIARAIEICLAEHHNGGSAENTLRKYRQLMRRFERFSHHLGLRWLEEWERKPSYVRAFRDSWEVSPVTASKQMGLVKAFFEIFVEDGILEVNPARIRTRRTRALKGSSTAPQKNPYADQELERMLEGCRCLGRTDLRKYPKKVGGREVVAITEFREYSRKWTGEDLADFIHISLHTGLRISDVATFHISRLTASGEVKLRATKNGNWVSVWIPVWLRRRIEARAQRIGPLIFGEHTTKDLNVITDVWRRKLKVLWGKTGPWKEKPTHHRFRHTFVRILLERSVPLSIIAELTGDTEEMIRRHYSAWMPERQANVSRILDQAFRDAPRYGIG